MPDWSSALRRRTAIAIAAIVGLIVSVAGPVAGFTPAIADPLPPPAVMASLGDSITRGFNACGWYVDCPSRSWSTGDGGDLASHYQRILAHHSAINGHALNLAKTGAKADALASQAEEAITQKAEYITILIGANDACADNEALMTAVDTYRAHINQALTVISTQAPQANVFIASIPDLKQLWAVGKDNFRARTAWSWFGICKSMLANPTSTAAPDDERRDRVRQRVIDYNTQLAAACVQYGENCRFDGSTVFSYQFNLNQLSAWDYFHPNASGQRVLAEVTYQKGFGW